MADTKVLLNKIAALRHRLEQTGALAGGSGSPSLKEEIVTAPGRFQQLEQQVGAGAQEGVLLDGALRQLVETTGQEAKVVCWPRELTFRARQVLDRGRDLLGRLRLLNDDPLLNREDADPLESRFRATIAMIEMALRVLQAFPESAGGQLRLCDGLEALLDVVDHRLASILALLNRRRQETGWLDTLAGLLTSLEAGKPADIRSFTALAEALLAEAQQGEPMRFPRTDLRQPAVLVASHSLMVAQVMARVIRHDSELRNRTLEYMLAALVHDAGMLRVPLEILNHPGPLSDDERRTMEAHTRAGPEMAARLAPKAAWLAEAAACHHERLDGTGYPAGLRDTQIPPLVRLLAVCDIYAALCMPRPHRAARETRTALTDTLLLAEQGKLDRLLAERLLVLTYYPVGSVVELADGAVGQVIAAHPGRDLNTPARPVVALLADAQGQLLPGPQYLDLGSLEGRSIVRSLSATERRSLLAKRYPELG